MTYSFGTDYGKNLLVDLNQLAHTAGTNAVHRAAFQRAFVEIDRLNQECEISMLEITELRAGLERRIARLRDIESQAIASTDPNYVAVPARLVYQQRHVLATGNLPSDTAAALEATRMEPRHDGLNELIVSQQRTQSEKP